MNLSEFVPQGIAADALRLGRMPRWCRIHTFPTFADGLPRTGILPLWDVLDQDPRNARTIQRMHGDNAVIIIAFLEAVSRMVADGPKMFQPSTEQWESMEHVELRLPPADFRTPYPVTLIQIPPACRRRLAAECGVPLDRAPNMVMVRCRREYPDEPTFVYACVPFKPAEEGFVFSDQPGNATIEEAICRHAPDGLPLANHREQQKYGLIACRAALNLCLLLTHYGCQVGPPLNPKEYAKHRAKKHLAHLAHTDVLSIEMKQTITVRRTQAEPTDNPPGPGSGVELRPHWRRGYWRAYPGQAAKRASGETVQLLFVRPCIVRRDRMVGDVSETEVVYHGG